MINIHHSISCTNKEGGHIELIKTEKKVIEINQEIKNMAYFLLSSAVVVVVQS